jgi:hypothetical protein
MPRRVALPIFKRYSANVEVTEVDVFSRIDEVATAITKLNELEHRCPEINALGLGKRSVETVPKIAAEPERHPGLRLEYRVGRDGGEEGIAQLKETK